jgi:tight adherence protein C
VPIVVYLSASGVVASVFLLRWALTSGSGRSSQTVRANLGQSRQRTGQVSLPGRPRTRRIPAPVSNESLQKRIAMAGLPWDASRVQLFRLVTAGASVVLGVLAAVAANSASLFILVAMFGALAAFIPSVLIRSRSDRRQRELELQLPDIFDRLKITLEAGLGFDSALASVVNGRHGPGYDEFKRVLQDLQLGVPRDEALLALSERTTVTDLRIILGAVLQSSKYGLPLVEVLRVQTEELRDKRYQRAQEQALKVPVKILFPLIFCILPAFFIVLVGPGLIRLARTL